MGCSMLVSCVCACGCIDVNCTFGLSTSLTFGLSTSLTFELCSLTLEKYFTNGSRLRFFPIVDLTYFLILYLISVILIVFIVFKIQIYKLYYNIIIFLNG